MARGFSLSLAACSALLLLLFFTSGGALASDARFDLVGPRIDVRVTRDGVTLPIASVPNLLPGDKLWIHPDLPTTQSVKYLLIVCFLRGTTNPPPEEWFTRIETWQKNVREEGTFITVPAEAQQALLFMAPETGGDFSTLRSAVRGRPGAFVRASQDLIEAGFEQARIERYLAGIRRVPPSDFVDLQKHSDLLARTLALKPNADCFKRPPDTQFTCLTQTGSQMVLDDGHGQNIVNALSNGPGSDLINQASYTQALGAGVYSAYVGAIVDVIRIMGNLHTAQFQYIPAISSPQVEALNLHLNTPPSFHNPKSVLVIALPAVQKAVSPPLRPADADYVACLIKPSVVLPIEGAPLVFSADFAHDLVLHLNTPPGAPAEPDIPLTPDAYFGGLIVQHAPQHHVPLREELPFPQNRLANPHTVSSDATPKAAPPPPAQPEPVMLTGTISGRWGFDAFTGPTVRLQQLPGTGWHIVADAAHPSATPTGPIAGHSAQLLIDSTGTACVHTITAQLANHNTAAADSPHDASLTIAFKPQPAIEGPADASSLPTQPSARPLVLTLPLEHDLTPGDLHLSIQQYEQPAADELAARTFCEPAYVTAAELHAGDRSLLLRGTRLSQIDRVQLGDLSFVPQDVPTQPAALEETASAAPPMSLRFVLADRTPAPSTHLDDQLKAVLVLHDGRTLPLALTVSAPRPGVTLLRSSVQPVPGSVISLSNPNDMPLNARLTFTLKTSSSFPRNGQVEIETLDGTLRTVLTLAPSGGLLLQDAHTVVATLDPLRSFGPSAFGQLHARAVYPPRTPHEAPAKTDNADSLALDTADPASDWLPLVYLVRLPTLTQLQCTADITQPCTVTGSDLFLIAAVSTDPAFSSPTYIPDGYTGSTLTVAHPAAATLFFKLRDDPDAINAAILPAAPAPAAHTHTTTHKSAPSPEPANPPTATPAATVNEKGPASSPGPSR